jgi:AcrR family transcriptional regulator
MTASVPERLRDAERSRAVLLEAAERLFAEHGYEGACLADIAAAAALSRGTPNYFFGSKEALYVAVLDRGFAARQRATAAAFAPVHLWCADEADLAGLRAALVDAAAAYLRFLAENPAFVALLMREELSRGERLRLRSTSSTAVHDAFQALRDVADARGLRPFPVEDAVLVFMGLTFGVASLSHTLLPSVGRDLARASERDHHVELVVDQLMSLVAG